jgi:phosphoribosylformylglycinamidine synthase
MTFAVLVFPGSNCDDDMVHALGAVLGNPVVKVWHKDHALPDDVDAVVLPGGFSFGDYLRTGAIARFSPIMKAVKVFAENGGIVIGICNGFQILCEAGLLPGVLLRNANQRFICKNVWIRPENDNSLMTAGLAVHQPLMIPIAHAEGRFYADAADVVLLALDPRAIATAGVPLRQEHAPDTGEFFPHLYGPLPLGAVVLADPYPGDASGAP